MIVGISMDLVADMIFGRNFSKNRKSENSKIRKISIEIPLFSIFEKSDFFDLKKQFLIDFRSSLKKFCRIDFQKFWFLKIRSISSSRSVRDH